MPVEAQLRLTTFCAWDLGRAEQQRPQRCLNFRWHVRTSTSCRDRIARLGYVQRLQEMLVLSRGQVFEVYAEALPANSGPTHARATVAHRLLQILRSG